MSGSYYEALRSVNENFRRLRWVILGDVFRLLICIAPLLLALIPAAPAFAGGRIGYIEFFGYKGLDIQKIRSSLPVHEGDEFSDGTKDQIRKWVMGAIGKPPTDVRPICCDDQGRVLLFIGLPGESYRPFAYNASPSGSERLPATVLDLYRRLDHAIEAAVHKGGESAQEDDSKGYALIKDPTARALQLQVRGWAIQHEAELFRILKDSSSVEDRRDASDAVGYVQQSPQQIQALERAARDADDDVRNNATRALGVLLRSNAALASQVAPGTFIAMLNSGAWTDRNKGVWVVMGLTAGRNPELLVKIRAVALDSLIEMALWRELGHAFYARIILGRVAGIPEEKLNQLAESGQVSAIVKTARIH